MIKKAVFFTIFLLTCWGIFLMFKPISLSKHQWQNNIIIAEKFILDMDNIDNLIVGSSLASRILMDSLPNYYNLSLSGQSIFDGLNILKNKKNLPKNVFIEINVISRGEDTNFKEIISSPILNFLKRSTPIFRTDKQPLAYLGNKFVYPVVNTFFQKIIYKIRNEVKIEPLDTKTSIDTKSKKSIYDKMLTLKKIENSKTIDTVLMNHQFEILKKQVNYLESKGVHVIFFEMPINHTLVELNKVTYLRNRVHEEFPSNNFIKLPNNIAIYNTTDGSHLTPEESKIYTIYFKNQASIITNKGSVNSK